MPPPPPLPWERKKSPVALAVIASLVYPGAGQFVLGRKISGVLLVSLTTTAAVWWLEAVARGLLQFYRAMPDGKASLIWEPIISPSWALGAAYVIGVAAAFVTGRMKARATS